ncbi:DNA packaging protein [Paenibacillus sp. FSL R5-0912]|uniref:DNA packaging protein n=1 Tax=Paenibacillus sp. FSL R5-0912 TaxID=1536771 RepID=UPI0004F92DE1|nr:DNA packaging protein [Paenibacillus sp. FSL R5-0912]AIQ41088.1 DNA packaging protein [Paenibacillus sp. FSL R5-0912]
MAVETVKKKSKFDLVMEDFKLFAKNFVKIVDNEGNLIPFILNNEQNDFVDNMGKFNIVSKARQIGLSTTSLAICLHQALLRPNSSYMIVSQDNKQVSVLFGRLKLMNDNLPRPKYKFPDTVRDNRDELVLSNGSRIQVSPPSVNLGRGSTYQFVLCSELAFYDVNQSKLLTSVTQSLAKNPDSKIVIESTSNGMNFYYDLFMRSWKGQTNYKAFFFSWTSKAYIEQFRYEHNIAEEWYKLNNKGQRLTAKDLTEDEKRIYDAGGNLRMIMWKKWKLSSMSAVDFMTEFPSTPEESFRTSGRNVFDQGKILERLENVLPPMSKDELKTELPEQLLKYIGKGLNIYHLPRSNVKYYGGSDVASGALGDSSSLSLMDSEGKQVLAFASNKISVYEFAEFLNICGRFYNYSFLAVEKNSYGLPCLQRLREDYHYMNLYKHKTFDQKGNKKFALGWLTSESSKSILISDFKENFEKGIILIEDKDTLQQMTIFVENNGKMGNKKGAGLHDDLIISHSLCVQAMKNNKWYV